MGAQGEDQGHLGDLIERRDEVVRASSPSTSRFDDDALEELGKRSGWKSSPMNRRL